MEIRLLVGIVLLTTDSQCFQPEMSLFSSKGPSKTSVSHTHHRRLLLRPASSRASWACSGIRMLSDRGDDHAPEGPNPQDWRKFRASLIANGIKISNDSAVTESSGTEAVDPNPIKVKSVSAANEKLLQAQNQKLYEEYLSGVWAHVTAEPEVGGLLCRLPLEAQIIHCMKHQDEDGSQWGKLLRERLDNELDGLVAQEEDEETKKAVRQSWQQNTPYVFKLTAKMIEEKMSAVIVDGMLSRSVLESDADGRTLILLYSEYQESWQEVILILHHDDGVSSTIGGGSQGVIINRPLALRIDARMTKHLLYGSSVLDSVVDDDALQEFLKAFGQKSAIYLGGPDEQENKGMMIHGVHGLEGAVEISPGTGVYIGGELDAAKKVLEGANDPLDFRFFIGCRRWPGPGEKSRYPSLAHSVRFGKYQPVACARPVCLKQCVGLPKPLWHEVMELCGGTSASLSQIEIQKRNDLVWE